MTRPQPWAITYLTLGTLSAVVATSTEGVLFQAGAVILSWTLFSLGGVYSAASWRQIRHGER